MIATPLTELLGVGVPLISAPMTPQAGGLLARAVSEAGAFGMVGIEETDTEEGIAAELAIVRAGTPVPFGIGLVSWVIDRRPELLDSAIDAKPTLISISFGDAGPHVERLHDAGILVASQVQSRHWAEVAIGAGVDILVAQGTEGGGHTGSVATLPLLQIVLELTDLPVVAAGGIATGRGLAAVRRQRRDRDALHERLRPAAGQGLAGGVRCAGDPERVRRTLDGARRRAWRRHETS